MFPVPKTSSQEGQIQNDVKRGENNHSSDSRKTNVSESNSQRVIGEKRPMPSSVDNQCSCNCLGSDCMHNQGISSLDQNRQLNTSTISKAKKTKIQQIKSH